jgi:hypothetical protein
MQKVCATGKISNPKDAEFILASGRGGVNEYLLIAKCGMQNAD